MLNAFGISLDAYTVKLIVELILQNYNCWLIILCIAISVIVINWMQIWIRNATLLATKLTQCVSWKTTQLFRRQSREGQRRQFTVENSLVRCQVSTLNIYNSTLWPERYNIQIIYFHSTRKVKDFMKSYLFSSLGPTSAEWRWRYFR